MNNAVSSPGAVTPLVNVLRQFLAIDNKLPISYAVLFLEIARNEGTTLLDLHTLTGMPVSTLSRIAGALAGNRQKNAQSFGLIRYGQDRKNGRRKPLYLTPKGKKLVRDLAGFLASKNA